MLYFSNPTDLTMSEVKNPKGVSRRILLATLWLTLLMLVVKVGAGWATRSLALLAESLHTVIDGFSTVLSLIAVSSPQRQLGREVWGHGRLEATIAFLLVAVLGFGCLSLLGLAIQQLVMTPMLSVLPPVRMPLVLIGVLTIVFLASLGLAYFEQRMGRLISSSALSLNARHILQDSWLTFALLIALLGIWRGYPWLDPILTILMVVAVSFSCWRVLNWQLPFMVRQMAIAPEAISQLVRQVQGVTHCYEVRSRGIVGRQVFVEMRLVLHPECLGMSPWIIEQIEASIRDRYGPVQVMIHLEETRHDPQHPLDSVRSNHPSQELD
jgi:cation diffusion facilitator family transporter